MKIDWVLSLSKRPQWLSGHTKELWLELQRQPRCCSPAKVGDVFQIISTANISPAWKYTQLKRGYVPRVSGYDGCYDSSGMIAAFARRKQIMSSAWPETMQCFVNTISFLIRSMAIYQTTEARSHCICCLSFLRSVSMVIFRILWPRN